MTMMTSLAAGILLAALPLTATAAITVDCAYYHVDVGGQYEWSEGAAGLTDFAKTDRRAGTLKVYLHNDGAEPADVEAVSLDGVGLEERRTSERHEVIWWRTWPNPIPAGGYAEVSVRLRYPLEQDATLALKSGDQSFDVTVPMQPPNFRIETIAWADGGSKLVIVPQKMGDAAAQVAGVFVDGVDVTARAKIFDATFSAGICPIEVELDTPLEPGSFHTYKVTAEDGQSVACTLRTLDEFLRLGMYGAGDLERNAKLGLNTASHFGAQSKGTLDRYAAFGMRSAFHVNANPPAPEVRGHPAVHAFVLHDEPDCWDYSAKEWPAPMRIGFHAPDIVKHTKQCAEADPTKPVQVTLDLTFKPANYYVYSQIPDIVTPDCYPLTIGKPLTWVRDVTEICRRAAGPRRVEVVPQVDFEDRQKAEMKFRRAPFAREVIIQYLYGLGSGARGFSGWEWFDEKADWCHFHGAPNFPDVLNAVGETYRRFKLLQPLILKAHPTDLATCETEKVLVKTLICGGDAAIIVVVNEDYESLPKDFSLAEKTSVPITMPTLPWMQTAYAARVDDGALTPLAVETTEAGTRIVLRKLDAGAIVVLSSDPDAGTKLLDGYEQAQSDAGKAMLRGGRLDQARAAHTEALKRLLMGRYAEYAAEVTTPLSAYGAEDSSFMNPKGAKYIALEWWTEATPRGGEWTVTIPEERAGVEHTVYFQMSRWWGGGYLRVEALDADEKLVFEADRPTWNGPIPNVAITFPEAGEYRIRILQAGEGKPGGRLGRIIYMVPATAGEVPGPAW